MNMKSIASILAFTAAVFFAFGAFASEPRASADKRLDAQALEIEDLKKDIEALKAANSAPPTMGYDKGFYIKSRDDDYLLKFRFFAQTYYQFDHLEGAADVNSFGIRRARLMMSGNVFNPKLTYMMMTEMATSYTSTNRSAANVITTVGPAGTTTTTVTDTFQDDNYQNFRLLNLWLQYKVIDEFQIRVGEFIPPNEYFFRASSLSETQNLPICSSAEPFFTGYHTGIDLLGTIANKLDYEAFAVNGSNLDRVNLNKSFRIGLYLNYNFLGRPGMGVADIDYSVKPQLTLMVSGAYERPDSSMAAPAGVNHGDIVFRGQTNAVFRYKGFAFVPQFIVYYDQTQHFKEYAYTAQAGYFIIPKHFEIAGSATFLKYHGPKNDQGEYIGGLNYYFYGQQVKLQADYSVLTQQMPSDNMKVDHRIRVGTQVGFF